MNNTASDASASAAPQTLDYARHAPWHRRRWKRLILGALLLLLVAIGWERYPAVRTQARFLYWQGKCIAYQAPPDQEIVPADPVTQSAGTGRPQAWREFKSLLNPPGPGNFLAWGIPENNTVFLHERISPKGNRRLVVIETPNPERRYGGVWETIFYTVHVIELGTVLVPPKDTDPLGSGLRMFPNSLARTRIFAGQADPQDPSHFTIRTLTGVSNEIVYDGWLRDDDSVIITQRANGSSRPVP